MVSKYYSVYGACDYRGRDCIKRAPGYKVEATKENILGAQKRAIAEGMSQIIG